MLRYASPAGARNHGGARNRGGGKRFSSLRMSRSAKLGGLRGSSYPAGTHLAPKLRPSGGY